MRIGVAAVSALIVTAGVQPALGQGLVSPVAAGADTVQVVAGPGWELSAQLYPDRNTATTTLSTFGRRRATDVAALLQFICYPGFQLELSVVSPDSVGEREGVLQTDVWIRNDNGERLELTARLIGAHRAYLDPESSVRVLTELVVDADTLDVLLFRGDGRPFRAAFPLGMEPPGVTLATFCRDGV